MKTLIYTCLTLGTMMMIALGGSFAADGAGGKYLGMKPMCTACHAKQQKEQPIFDQWEKSKHANATKSLGDKKADPECLKCHSTGFGQEGGMTVEMAKDETPKMAGVQCEACHGPAGNHAKAKKEEKEATINKPTKETCAKCHTDKHPGGEVEGWKAFNYEEALKKVAHPKIEK